MKKTTMTLAICALLTAGIFAFSSVQTGSIKGTVTPPQGATSAMAISGMDTLKSAISEGTFDIAVPTGTYKLLINAAAPYKDYVKENVTVSAGNTVNLGQIKLER